MCSSDLARRRHDNQVGLQRQHKGGPDGNIGQVVKILTEHRPGALITDVFGNQLRTPDGWTFTDAQFFIPAYAIGKKWSTRFQVSGVGRLGSFTGQSEIDFKVTAREQLTVPAGSFDAFRIEGEGWTQLSLGGAVQIRHRYWIAPGLRRPIATETYRRHTSGRILGNEREELTAYRQS